MAGTLRDAPEHLAPLVAELRAQPQRFSLFAALRLLEQWYADQPRFGTARELADEPVRCAQTPHLAYEPNEVADFGEGASTVPRLEQFAFGLFGPEGPLPLHLTEFALERSEQHNDPLSSEFVNLFQHRMILLFYRAWANADPATNLDRPQADRFKESLGALLGLPASASESAAGDPRLSCAAHFAPGPRSAAGLEAVLTASFDIEVQVRQFMGAWFEIPESARLRLGTSSSSAMLGSGATLGVLSWQRQAKFEIVMGPLDEETLRDFLPGSPTLARLTHLVRQYTNDQWDWQIRLLPTARPAAQLRVGPCLGWTTWVGAAQSGDVVLQRAALEVERRPQRLPRATKKSSALAADAIPPSLRDNSAMAGATR
jgi:type VI secretion system protein ImpH